VQLGSIAQRDTAQRGLAEWLARLWDAEAGPLQIANGEARGIRVNKVAHSAPTICENGSVVFTFKYLAVIDEQPCGDAVAQRLGLEFL
jgi:hypothetical protein